MTDLQRTEMQKKKRTERILNLTLEIIYLLTGEDYKVVKKTSEYLSNSSLSCSSRGLFKRQSLAMESSLLSPIPERNNDKKILEIINKMIGLLTGEVPIRCQDVSVCPSMEEKTYIEGHKDAMMGDRPPLTSPDGSSNRNPPERCPRPLYSRDPTHEDPGYTKGTQTGNSYEQVKVHVRIKEEEEPLEISTDGRYKTFTTERCPPERYTLDRDDGMEQEEEEDDDDNDDDEEEEVVHVIKEEKITPDISPDGETEDDGTTPSSSQKNPTTRNLHPVRRSAKPSSKSSTRAGRLPNRPRSATKRTSHTGPKMYVCSDCGQAFPERVELVIHRQCHKVEKPYACPQCGKCYSQRALLNRHLKAHSGDKPYPCPECGKSFSHSQYLVLHQRSHTGEKPYACEECGKCFFRSDHLIRHRRFHTGEKPYACSECGKCFAVRFCLTEHERIHTGERPYSCAECGRGFTSRSNLASHARVHTGHHPYSCSECGKQFSKKAYLMTHLSSHGEQEAPVSESDA